MFTIRKATTDDCGLINQMAGEVFPATYKEILSPEQLDYMMDWMYSPENKWKKKAMFILSRMKSASPAATSLYNNRKKMYSIFRKFTFSPIFKARTAAAFYSEKLSNI